ncbi:MAG: nickel pincer cofactor biosynthesis protein LarC [Dehalococcoidia bacterium]|nr:nickel pincer cofactor biosynthesis protein LarC [Dehalococcoidia bacterium]
MGYLHCIGGASGDMLLGALIDAGLSLQELRGELSKLPLMGYSIEAGVAQRGVVRGTQVIVNLHQESKRINTIHDFLDMVEASSLSVSVKEKACKVLGRLEAAEARVHGESHELQELGEIDTIIDVVGVAAGLEALGIERLYSSPLPSGWGVISSRKGALPVPVPATMELITMANAKVTPAEGPYLNAGELVTPTGAALVTTLASFDVPPLTVEKMGYGVGSKDMAEIPNVLALWIGETQDTEELAHVSLLETNIDDTTPEVLGYVQEKLMGNGALDVWFTPIQMKKNRPAVALSVICRPSLEPTLIKVILEESSTLGVRVHPLKRHEAEREVVSVHTSLGRTRVKVKKVEGKIVSISPEFEDCKGAAEREKLPLQEVYRRVERDARISLGID